VCGSIAAGGGVYVQHTAAGAAQAGAVERAGAVSTSLQAGCCRGGREWLHQQQPVVILPLLSPHGDNAPPPKRSLSVCGLQAASRRSYTSNSKQSRWLRRGGRFRRNNTSGRLTASRTCLEGPLRLLAVSLDVLIHGRGRSTGAVCHRARGGLRWSGCWAFASMPD
jgi:hypothetical protein